MELVGNKEMRCIINVEENWNIAADWSKKCVPPLVVRVQDTAFKEQNLRIFCSMVSGLIGPS